MTAREIQTYMIRNGAPASEVFCDVVNDVVYFDIREVPRKSWEDMPVIMVSTWLASVAGAE